LALPASYFDQVLRPGGYEAYSPNVGEGEFYEVHLQDPG
jgi:hypothetical protein